jgi:acetylornithine deacetylase
VAKSHQNVTGEKLESFATAGYLDTRVYALYERTPALRYGPISRNIHGFEECTKLPSLQRIAARMALFVAEWCGTETYDA